MQIPRLLMQQTYAKLQMSTTPSRQEVEQPQADLEIQQPRAVMNIKRTPSKLTIDQTEAFADMDIKSIFRRSEEWAAEGSVLLEKEWVAERKKEVNSSRSRMVEMRLLSLPKSMAVPSKTIYHWCDTFIL